jgi:hypothetical protein
MARRERNYRGKRPGTLGFSKGSAYPVRSVKMSDRMWTFLKDAGKTLAARGVPIQFGGSASGVLRALATMLNRGDITLDDLPVEEHHEAKQGEDHGPPKIEVPSHEKIDIPVAMNLTVTLDARDYHGFDDMANGAVGMLLDHIRLLAERLGNQGLNLKASAAAFPFLDGRNPHPRLDELRRRFDELPELRDEIERRRKEDDERRDDEDTFNALYGP